jgi:hypothetical protein
MSKAKYITKKVNEVLLDQDTMASLLEYYDFVNLEDPDALFEGKFKKPSSGEVNQALGKIGIHVKKKNQGLFSMIVKSGKAMGKVLWLAVKAVAKDSPESRQKLKEAIQKLKVNRSQIIDFFLKIDTLTMHLFTGPIHMIEAVTGWHIAADLARGKDDTTAKIQSSIGILKAYANQLIGPIKNRIMSYVTGIETTIQV